MLLRGLREDSEFKKVAERDGDWTESERIAADTYAEISRLTEEVSKVVSVLAAQSGVDYDTYGPKHYLSPVQRRKPDESKAEPTQDDSTDANGDFAYMGM